MRTRAVYLLLSVLCALMVMPTMAFADTLKIAEPSQAYNDWVAQGQVSEYGYAPSPLDLSYLADSAPEVTASTFAAVPASYDLRERGTVTSVKNQSPYGTCWAFGSLAALESGLVDRYPWVDFSETHVVTSAYSSKLGLPGLYHETPFYAGGWNEYTVFAFSLGRGPAAEWLYPYANPNDVGKDDLSRSEFALKDASYLAGLLGAGPGNDALKSMLMDGSALSVAYFSDGKYFNREHLCSYCPIEDTDANHQVLLVGWDDSFSKENFGSADVPDSRPPSDGAWLCRNSWGESHRETDDGYFWISYYDKSFYDGCAFVVDDNERSYVDNADKTSAETHSELGWDSALIAETHSFTTAEVFVSDRTCQLDDAAFYTGDNNLTAKVDIYTDVQNPKDPRSGTLQATIEERYPYAGYHRASVPSHLVLTEGERWSMVVTYEGDSGIIHLPTERRLNEVFRDVTIEENQSFFFDEDTWVDLATIKDFMDAGYGNFCAYAYTSELDTVVFDMVSGPVETGKTLGLTCFNTQARIVYTSDGTQPNAASPAYPSGGIVLDDLMGATGKATVQAAAVGADGHVGPVTQATYYPATASMSSLLIEADDSLSYATLFDTSGCASTEDRPEFVSSGTVALRGGSIALTPISTDTITLTTVSAHAPVSPASATSGEPHRASEGQVDYSQGAPVTSGQKITLDVAAGDTIQLTTTAAGKGSHTYTLAVEKASYINFDYANETVSSIAQDCAAFVGDAELTVGASVSDLAGMPITVHLSGGETYEQAVPSRSQPPALGVAEQGLTTVTLTAVEGARYALSRSASAPLLPGAEAGIAAESALDTWQASPTFSGLTPDTAYTAFAYLPANEAAGTFRSEVSSLAAKTRAQAPVSPGAMEPTDRAPLAATGDESPLVFFAVLAVFSLLCMGVRGRTSAHKRTRSR